LLEIVAWVSQERPPEESSSVLLWKETGAILKDDQRVSEINWFKDQKQPVFDFDGKVWDKNKFGTIPVMSARPRRIVANRKSLSNRMPPLDPYLPFFCQGRQTGAPTPSGI
jgi:hypothetical protein